MDLANAKRMIEKLGPSMRVVDVGGGAMPFPRADYVIDALPYEGRATLGEMNVSEQPRFNQDTWCQVDLCDHTPWPFPDKFFDFATCSHLLEDVRDPIWICRELNRVAKAGYIEVPSRVLEQSMGVEHPRYAGFYHHRWLIERVGNGLEFRHKPHALHAINDAIVTHVGVSTQINPEHAIVTLDWEGSFDYREVLEFDEAKMIEEICGFASNARQLPTLTVPTQRSVVERVKRMVYFRRLSRGRR